MTLTKILPALLLLGIGSALYADDAAPVSEPTKKETKKELTPSEIKARGESVGPELDADYQLVLRLKGIAEKKKDVIKLNCVNDKLLQVKQLLNIADSARASLGEAISSRNDGDRYHQFTVITVSSEKARALNDEAEACIGQEIVFSGRASIDVDAPDIADDPTRTDPFALASFGIERPTYATPFL